MLGGLVDGAIPLDDNSVGVVKDTLAILACKEIKLSSLRRYVIITYTEVEYALIH